MTTSTYIEALKLAIILDGVFEIEGNRLVEALGPSVVRLLRHQHEMVRSNLLQQVTAQEVEGAQDQVKALLWAALVR